MSLIQLEFHGFDWDAGNFAKSQRHGVTVQEIEELFTRPLFATRDLKHSDAEERWIAVGTSSTNRALFVALTMRTHRGRKFIRVISARYMHAQEVNAYEALKNQTIKTAKR